MNTIAHNVASKLFVAFVAVAMLFTLATPAKAATAEELQQMINDLLAQVASLQGQLGQGGSSAAGVCPFTWTRTLTTGATGSDVMTLQKFLNASADTQVSASGVGSAGMETEYFGPATAAAVSKFQVKNGVVAVGTGTFGPLTMAKANALCATAPATDDTDEDTDTEDTTSDLQGEASLDQFDAEDGDDTELEEGQEDAPVAEFQVKFENGDAMITRLDVSLVGTGDETDPWDTFEEVSLWVDGDKIADVDASDEDNYLDENAGSIRFAGLEIVAEEDDEVVIEVAVSVMGSVDGVANGEDWTVTADSMRYVDGDDVTTTEDNFDDLGNTGVAFSIDAEGIDDELVVKTSSEDPESTTLALEDDAKSDWLTVFAWTLDTDDSVNDIVVNNLLATVTVSSSTYNAVVYDAKVVVDGVEYDDVTIANGATTAAGLDFNTDGDLVIDAGDEVTAELMLKFKQLELGNEGMTVSASTDSDFYDAEGADDLDTTQLQGTATGDTHTLRTSGAVLELTDTSETLKANSDTDLTDDEGVFTVEFDVTAFNGDLYIDDIANRGTSLADGINYIVTTGGSATTSGTVVATLDSGAELTGGKYLVSEGATETFTLTVEYDPAATGAYKVQLYSVNFKIDVNTTADTMQLALPAEDFDTASLTI